MNPGAPHFSPSDLALVVRGGAVMAGDDEGRPQDLIIHQTLKDLIQDVHALKTRASHLETQTRHLEKENERLQRVEQENEEIKMQVMSLRQALVEASAAQAMQGNVSGYVVSESSSSSKHVLSPDFKASLTAPADLTPDTGDADFKKNVEKHRRIVNQLLENFNGTLTEETSKREELQKEVTQIQNILKAYKGRTGVVEFKFGKMVQDVSELEVAVQNVQSSLKGSSMPVTKRDAAAISPYMQDQIEKLQGNFDAAMARLIGLEGDVDAHRCILNDFVQSQESKSGGAFSNGDGGERGNDGVWASTSANYENGWAEDKSDGMHAGKVQDKLMHIHKQLDTFQLSVDNRTKDKRDIDNAPTRDRLYELYHSFTKDMGDNWTAECQDDLWELRDRVLVRLAIFDLYGKAVVEAKTAKVL